MNKLENLNRQLRISDVIDVLMAQSLQLMEIVNKNQKEVNRLKAEQDKLKSAIKGQQTADELYTANATDQLDDDGDKYRDADIMINQ